MKSLLSVFWIVVVTGTGMFAQSSAVKPHVFASLSVSKTEIFVGECAILQFSFTLYNDNEVPTQFYNLEEQVSNLLVELSPGNALLFNSQIDNVTGKSKLKGKDPVTEYLIYEGAICPVEEGIHTIPDLSIEMMHLTVKGKDTVKTTARYFTESVSIKAKSVLKSKIDSLGAEHRPVTGMFKLREELQKKYSGNKEHFEYSITVTGYGQTGYIFPEFKRNALLQVDLIEDSSSDYIWEDTLFANRTFKFLITPTQPGVFKLADLINPIRYFDPSTQKVKTLAIRQEIIATSKSKRPHLFASDTTETALLLVDISRSMDIDDYFPTRLDFVKNEIKRMFAIGYPIEIIFFSGSAKLGRDLLQKPIPLDSITSSWIKKKGTAMGDAVMFAIRYAQASTRKYSHDIFLIGDGDQTTGRFPPALAAESAKEKGFKIYAIGVGTLGSITFRGQKINNTFSEQHVRLMSQVTQATYTKIEQSGNLLEIISSVMREK